MMSPEKVGGLNIASDIRESCKKEWSRPSLRKLPIAATAGTEHETGDDGNMKKVGKAGNVS